MLQKVKIANSRRKADRPEGGTRIIGGYEGSSP
jgi:hypothetical protein